MNTNRQEFELFKDELWMRYILPAAAHAQRIRESRDAQADAIRRAARKKISEMTLLRDAAIDAYVSSGKTPESRAALEYARVQLRIAYQSAKMALRRVGVILNHTDEDIQDVIQIGKNRYHQAIKRGGL